MSRTETPRPGDDAVEAAGAAPGSVAPGAVAYDDGIVGMFTAATLAWGLLGMAAAVLVALQLVLPAHEGAASALPFLERPWLSFGRLRPVLTYLMLFAFIGNALFAGMYDSTQRLLRTPMRSTALSRVHFWGWQAIAVAVALTLPAGVTQGRAYAEPEWPIDVAIGAVWLVFAVNFLATLSDRRVRRLHVSLWFYVAAVVAFPIAHVVNGLAVPVGWLESYPVYAGVHDAIVQAWYVQDVVVYLLLVPFLGLMYDFLPRAAGRPLYSWRLAVVHFWSLLILSLFTGPRLLHYTAVPAWLSTLGLLASIMLWMPAWGGLLNGLLTLRGAWSRVRSDPVLQFFSLALALYGLFTAEAALLSFKSAQALLQPTGWTVAHLHLGGLGWAGFMTFGMIYWLLPRLFRTDLWSPRLAHVHVWLATIGVGLSVVPLYAAAVVQGLAWRAFDEHGQLAHPVFMETLDLIAPLQRAGGTGGAFYAAGLVLCAVNLLATWWRRPRTIEPRWCRAAPLGPAGPEPPPPASRLEGASVAGVAHALDRFAQLHWHRRWEARPARLVVAIVAVLATGSLLALGPALLLPSTVRAIPSVEPYTPLELAGRDVYVAEGCAGCHTQMVRPIHAETFRYGDWSRGGEFVYDFPVLWGARRLGPDLHRVGGRYSHLWHVLHQREPASMTAGSIMPAYPELAARDLDFAAIPRRVRAMRALGVPYVEAEVEHAETLARRQARAIYDEIVEQDGPVLPAEIADKQIIALVAYLQRLGRDLHAAEEAGP